jgi:hypothetical protein
MKKLVKSAAVAALAVSALAVSVSSASAAIVCNREGECWHVRGAAYTYRPEFGLVVHENNWRCGPAEHYRWHEHEGRGYWHSGVWIKI